MSLKRREFIKSMGIGFASLILSQCASFPRSGDSDKDRLRDCWLSLVWLGEQTTQDYERAQDERSRLLDDHRTLLNLLVRNGEISSLAADQLQVAYSEATYHVWRSHAPMTCYLPAFGPDYTPTSSSQLTAQAEILADLSDDSLLDPATITKAQAAIKRDIAFLNLTEEKVDELYKKLVEAAGDTGNYPDFDELDIDISAASLEAAQFLVDLILEINPMIEDA